MKFTITHTRAFVGSNITVSVEADEKEILQSVGVVLDGDSLDSGEIEPGTQVYTQEYSGVGEAGAGAEHVLTVTAMSNDGQPHVSITRWVDTI